MDDLLDTAPCGFVSFRENGSIIDANATLLGLLGLGRDEILGMEINAILTLPSRVFYQTHLFPTLRLSGRVDEVYLTLRGSDGASLPMLANFSRRERDGDFAFDCVALPIRHRKVYEDDLRRAKEEAEQALANNQALREAKEQLERYAQELDRKVHRLEHRNDELARVSQVLSHDLREPIRKIRLFADLLAQEESQSRSAKAREYMEVITASCDRMSQLVQGLRQFLAVELANAENASVDLNEAVSTAEQLIASTTGGAELRIEAGALPRVCGDREQLVALFRALFDNAVKFQRPGAPPVVHVEGTVIRHNSFRVTKGRYRYIEFARLIVRDNGMGFDPRYENYVFQLLSKIDRDTPGMGIGLAICKKIVDNHYGSIAVDSEPGVGTRFTILLPLEQ